MKILGIDTTTKYLCLGIGWGDKIYECNLDCGIRHSSLLTVTIERSLAALGLGVKDIDFFACGIGPGSFTGVRVGLSAIKGFAWALKKPLIGISTLDILAMNADRDGLVVPAIDAKRKLIYCSIYKKNKGILKRMSPYMLLSEGEFLKKVRPASMIFGDAMNIYKDNLLRSVRGAIVLDKDYWYPKGHNIIPLAKERIANRKLDNVFKIDPIYLYPKECQIKAGRKDKR